MSEDKIEKCFEEEVSPPKIFYYSESDKLYMEDGAGCFRGYRKGVVATRLEHECNMTRADMGPFFAEAYKDKNVDLVTPIGGWRKGLHRIGQKRVLVPLEQRRIDPVKGEWPTLKTFYLGMLGKEQFEWYMGWLKTWLEGFYGYSFTPGQVLILLGETSSGKTLLRDIHNHIFDGGGQPLKYMTGKTGFNGELCESCSLYIDDKLNELGTQGKIKLKAECKELAVSGELRFEFKNRTAFTASPVQRLLICCNYTDDSVSVVPDIDQSTRNKISILDCSRKPMPMPARSVEEKKAFWKKLKEEIPAFINHVLNEHVIDERFADLEEERMGVRGYHNEKAMKYVETHSNEGKRLFAMIEALRKESDAGDLWEGSAGALLKVLKDNSIEYKATPTSIGRFLNQRMDCGSKLVEQLGQRLYRIDLREYEGLSKQEPVVEEEEKGNSKPVEDSQDELFKEDPIEKYWGTA